MKENEKNSEEDSKHDNYQDLSDSKIIQNNKDDPKDIEEENKIFDEIEKIEKIVCPECGIIPNLEIESQNYTVKSNCPECQNKEIKNCELVDYIKQSNEKIPKFIKCDECKKTNEDLEIEKNEMFICICGKKFCEDCKEKHEEINDSKNHEFIKYSEKDYQCNCKDSFSDYNSFCVTCNTNLCAKCQIEHEEENQQHKIIFFTEEIGAYLTKDIIEKKKKNFKEKSNKINEFIEELKKWKEEFDFKIKHLTNNLKLLMKVNNYILNSFDKSNLNQQIIQTLMKLDFSYNTLIDEFIKNKDKDNSFEIRYQYLLGLFNYQKRISNINLKKKKYINKIDLEDLNILKNNSRIIEGKAEETITAICQFGKGFVVGDIKGQIHYYSPNTKLKKLIKKITIYDKLEINYLCSLNDNYFISSNKDEIKIIKLDNSQETTQYNVIKTFKYNDEEKLRSSKIMESSFQKESKNELIKNDNDFQLIKNKRVPTIYTSGHKISINYKKYYQILKLLNDNIIYLNEDKIMRLEPAFNNNYIRKTIEIQKNLNSNLICMVEISEDKFCVYSENNYIKVFDSNKFTEIENKGFSIGNTDNICCTKIQMIDKCTMAGMGKDKIYLISLNKCFIVQTINTEKTIIDMITTKSNKILISGYYKNKNYLIQYNYKVLKDEISLSRNDIIEFGTRINLIFLLDNNGNNKGNLYGRLLCIHNDNTIQIYETNNNNNNIKK